MNPLLKMLAIVVLLADFSYCQDTTFIHKVDAYLNSLSEDENFGLSIVIAKDGENLLERSYGYASREYNVPNKLETKFNIASIGKMFTAVAILQLREQGKIDVNQTIGYYIPDFPNSFMRDSTTVHQLLTHTSGLPLWFNDAFDRAPKFDYIELSDYLSLYEDLNIDKDKIGQNSYSNVGFITLGFVIEAVSKQSYRAYLQQHIFEPLQMQETGLWRLTEIIPEVATGYIRPSSKQDWWKTNYHLNKGSSPAGGAYASARDLAKFYHGLMSGQLLSQESRKLMMEPKTKTPYGEYGYGIGISKNNNQTIMGHLGGYYGVRGELMWYREANYVVAILANSDQTDYIDLSYFIKTGLTGTIQEREAYARTLELIRSIDFHSDKLVDIHDELAEKGKFDEDLIQIKGYYHFNNQDYRKAEKLFALNYRLFPNSASAKRDVEMVKN
ncbi:MAG: serine hydrolase domain-containing protein [Bacteroidota bacterium]